LRFPDMASASSPGSLRGKEDRMLLSHYFDAASLLVVPRRRHAVVVGGSMAGMLAARVLSDHFDDVTLLERDRFSETPAARTHCWNAAAESWSGSSRA
jgi:hypothetical protein